MTGHGPGQRRPGFGMPAGPGRTAEPEAGDPPPLAADATVDLAAERRRSDVDSVLTALDRELIGLDSIKAKVRDIASLLLVDRARRQFGLTSTRPSLHMSFTGNPGTGKTTVALRMAGLLQRLGYIERGHLVAVTRDDLVGQYVGHTAPKTKEVLKRAMGGVLFIDEAYHLHRPDNERDYGQEAVEILLQVMESEREHLVVIMAGYQDRMDAFFASNPGLSSRIAHHLEFPDYDVEALMAIARLMLEGENYRFSETAEKTFREYLRLRMERPRFSNARSVRNALERARLRQAHRLVSATGRGWGKDDLMRFEPEDFLGSSVFSGEAGGGTHSAA
ncbi:CbbX protein [Streptomyces caeni]|uniref:CbbX protein n=1 Tax=Streptomyces caeni TaxID=2307231 RepID=A0ABW4J0U2_9ACTN